MAFAGRLPGVGPSVCANPGRAVIGLTNLSKNFGAQTLFENVSMRLDAGHRYGLVGANGSGKTTLLRVLTGDEPPSGGEITYPRTAKLGVLRQDRFLNDDQIILDVAMMGDEIAHGALKEQDALAAEDDPDPHRIGEVDELLHAVDGYTLEARASEVLVGLGIPEDKLAQPLRTLSGGYKLRVLLAQVLVGRPDALLLDEPTNHLDILSIRWLERFLLAYKGCAVVISHDHRFLNGVATDILDVDYDTVTAYRGNYDAFVQQKIATRERMAIEQTKAQKAIAEKKAFVERFKAKATKARQASSRAKQIERIEIVEPPRTSRRYPKFTFGIVRPSGKDVVEVQGLSKAYGDNSVLDGVGLTIRRGERVAVIGANGLGKSTLLKIMTGRLDADAGSVKWGHETHVGYFAQDHKEQLTDPKQTVLSHLWEVCPRETTGFVRGQLGKVLFSGDDVEKKIAALSGGEATRLVLSRLVVQKPNVMVLDEPTNHLDLESIEALTEALAAYQGTLIFVSHDRWFVSQLATRIVEVKRDGLNDFAGTYDEYLEREGDDHLDADAVELRAKKEKKAAKKGKPQRSDRTPDARIKQLKKQRDAALARVEAIEVRQAAIQDRYCEPGFFENTSKHEIETLRDEEARLGIEHEKMLTEWEDAEEELEELGVVAD